MTTSQTRRFHAAINKLNGLIEEIRETTHRDAEYYFGEGTLYLLAGPHHCGRGEQARDEYILASALVDHADGGGW